MVSHELKPSENIFSSNNDPYDTYMTIKRIDSAFMIHRGQEEEFNRFLVDKADIIRSINKNTPDDFFVALNGEWVEYFEKIHFQLVSEFHRRLKKENLIRRDIHEFSSSEIKVFDMLFQFFYSFSSKSKQERIIHYFIDTVSQKKLSDSARERLARLLLEKKPESVRDLKELLYNGGLDRIDLFEAFKDHDEDLLLTEFNQGIQHYSWNF